VVVIGWNDGIPRLEHDEVVLPATVKEIAEQTQIPRNTFELPVSGTSALPGGVLEARVLCEGHADVGQSRVVLGEIAHGFGDEGCIVLAVLLAEVFPRHSSPSLSWIVPPWSSSRTLSSRSIHPVVR